MARYSWIPPATLARRNKVAIIQPQRGAIEELCRGRDSKAASLPAQIELAQLVLDDSTPLHVLGISEGNGSHSDVRGMDVLVVGDSPLSTDGREVRRTTPQCAFAVLLRLPTEQELAQWEGSPDSRGCLRCVELLRFRVFRLNEARVVFARTGKHVLYPNI